MRALVISGGGSKGAYAGGVAQYLIQEEGHKYDMYVGTSTGSLLVPHLAAGKIDKIYKLMTNSYSSLITIKLITFPACPLLTTTRPSPITTNSIYASMSPFRPQEINNGRAKC